MFLLGTENGMGWGITDIPDSRTRRLSGVGLGAGKKILGHLILEQGVQQPPSVLVLYINEIKCHVTLLKESSF